MNQRRTDIDKQSQVEEGTKRKKNDLIVITGAGGFIAGNLVLYFKQKGFTRIRAVDKKQLGDWILAGRRWRASAWIAPTRTIATGSAKEQSRCITWRRTWAAWGLSSAFGWRACAAFSSTRT